MFLGTLLQDEMKLSESVSFNKKTFEINGLKNLGNLILPNIKLIKKEIMH